MTHIQIILYNSIKHLPLLIKGFNIIAGNHNICIHFLENSEEESKKFIVAQSIEFKYTYDCEKTNLGFGRGHNSLFKKYHSGYGDYFIILNPDILPFYNFLEELTKFIYSVRKTWGVIDLTQFPEEHPKDYQDDYETGFASGAASVYKTRVFKKVNRFDDNIFMYTEDVDISWRIKEENFSVLHCPTSKIAHTIGGSTRSETEQSSGGNSTFQKVHMCAGNLYIRYKYFGDKEIKKYKRLIRKLPEYKEIISQFEKMKSRLTDKELGRYREYKSSIICPDTNYAKHRW